MQGASHFLGVQGSFKGAQGAPGIPILPNRFINEIFAPQD
jgi:hypothetical protein